MTIMDTSTLILLAKTNLLRLVLERGPISVPPAVIDEILAKPEQDDTRMILELVKVGEVARDQSPDPAVVSRLSGDFRIGKGEAEALALASEKGAALATDDRRAMAAARALGVPFSTSLSFLVQAARENRLSRDRALAKLDELSRLGRYSAAILEGARRMIEGG